MLDRLNKACPPAIGFMIGAAIGGMKAVWIAVAGIAALVFFLGMNYAIEKLVKKRLRGN